MSCRTVFLPPAPPRIEERFDRYQFRKRTKMVSAKTGLDHDDAGDFAAQRSGGMHLTSQGSTPSQMAVPPWTKSDSQVKLVICRMLYGMCAMTQVKFPQDEFDKNPLGLALELEVALRKRCINFATQRSPMVQAGILGQKKSKRFGYARLLTRIIYERYRLGKNSAIISGELHGLVSPVGVRQILNRSNQIARVHLPEGASLPLSKRAGQAAKDDLAYKRIVAQSGRTNKQQHKNLPSAAEFFTMSQNGQTATDIAQELGVHPDVVRKKICLGRRQTFRLPRKQPKVTAAEIYEMHQDGESPETIAVNSALPLAYVVCVLTTKFGVDLTPTPNTLVEA